MAAIFNFIKEHWLEVIDKIPLVSIVPIFVKAWDGMPEDKKVEIATNILMAAGKAAESYASKT